jgi:hypothetical protein
MKIELNHNIEFSRPITFFTLWKQLGSRELIGLPLLWLSIIIYFPSQIWVDNTTYSAPLYFWILFFVCAHVIFWSTMIVVHRYFQNKLSWEKPHPFINGLTIGIAVLVRFAFATTFLHMTFGGLGLDSITSRLIAAVGVATILFIAGGLLSVSNTEHTRAISQLADAAYSLDKQRVETLNILKKTDQHLMNITRTTLLPLLDDIKTEISLSKSRVSLVEQVRETIKTRVRPLSSDLYNLAIKIEPVQDQRNRVKRNFSLLMQEFSLRNSLWPLPVYVAMTSWIIFTMTSFDQGWFIVRAALVWSTYPIIIQTIKFLIPKNLKVRPLRGLIVILLVNYVAVTPYMSFAILSIPGEVTKQFLVITYFLSSLILVTLAGASVVITDQREIEKSLAKVNLDLSHQLSIVEQKLWISRRNWSSLIHGPVQSALTVALFKLQNTTRKVEDEILDSIRDVERMILEGPISSTQIFDGLESIRKTWVGVCYFKYRISEQAEQILLDNQMASDCVIEIATELVGNAYRHGGARWINFNVDCDPNGDLRIFSQNDGALFPKIDDSGLGTKMLNELTLSWRLESQVSTALTEFTALVPVQKVFVN